MYNNPFISRDLSGKELAQLHELVQSPGWRVLEEIQTFQQGTAISIGMNINSDREQRDAQCGIHAATSFILNFKDDVAKLPVKDSES